jgi:hypothetical protein
VLLTYTWSSPPRGLKIRYDLFLPSVASASCLATILAAGKLQTFVFTPEDRELLLLDNRPGPARLWWIGAMLALTGSAGLTWRRRHGKLLNRNVEGRT